MNAWSEQRLLADRAGHPPARAIAETDNARLAPEKLAARHRAAQSASHTPGLRGGAGQPRRSRWAASERRDGAVVHRGKGSAVGGTIAICQSGTTCAESRTIGTGLSAIR